MTAQDNPIYANSSFELRSSTFTEGEQAASVTSDGNLILADGSVLELDVAKSHPQLASDCAMLDAMYGVSLHHHELATIDPKAYFYMLCNRFRGCNNIPDSFIPEGSVFWAGYGFNTFLYTRDAAYSSWLGTAYVLPEVVRSHLQYLRSLRKVVGWKLSQHHEIPLAGLPQKQLDISESELCDKYNTNSYTRRTDDIIWVLGLWEVYRSTQDHELLSYILSEFEYFDENFYRHFFDEDDGLYRGQPTFIDVAGPCYPERGPGRTVILKALSTNGLYAGCFGMLAQAADLLGRTEKATTLRERREKLIQAIRTNFGENSYAFYKHEDGTYSDRQETLGLAFLAIFDILPPGRVRASACGVS